MALRLATGVENYPPGWDAFEQCVRHVGAQGFGFSTGVGDVNRFAARYRAAKAFVSTEFDGLSATTSEGYSALIKLLLAYSAFEHLLRCIGIKLSLTNKLLSDEERDKALGRLRVLGGNFEFFSTLRTHLDDRRFTRQIDEFLAGGQCNIIYLAAGVRHAFAHGQLTASPASCPPQSVATCCR